MTHPLFTEWATWQPDKPPFIFAGDSAAIKRLEKRGRTCSFTTWPEYCASDDFGRSTDRKLHLGLLPHPFAGNPETAKIVILMLNPGLGPHDAFGELAHV